MTDYEKLKSIIDEIDNLINHNVTSETPGFIAWKNKSERFLIKKYGKGSLEHNHFNDTEFSLRLFLPSTPHSEFVKVCKSGLVSTKLVFKDYLDELDEELPKQDVSTAICNTDKIFVVHGHDGELKHAVARIIAEQGIEPIILSEQANQGRTIIEKFENYSDVGGAICLFTADDYGRAKNDSFDNTRARQNVVLETGYFMGKIGRNKVVILADEGIEMPSDLSGIVYTNTGNWKIDLLKDLKAMGYNIDFNKLF